VPLRNVTVPVAVVGETVAVNVTLVPVVVVVAEDVSVTVLDVDPEGAFQKSPHPVPNPINNGAASPRRIRVLPLRFSFNFMTTDPFSSCELGHFQLKSEQNPLCPIHCAPFAQWMGEHTTL
jgi:hypothetical protein